MSALLDMHSYALPADPASQGRIIVASFGTTHRTTREANIGAIEARIAESFPTWDVARAFTAQTIIEKIKRQEGLGVMNLEESICAARDAGVRLLVIQPTHLLAGHEFGAVRLALEHHAPEFERVALGRPLLSDRSDLEAVARIMKGIGRPHDDGSTAFVFLGHGTSTASDRVYQALQDTVDATPGMRSFFICTVEGAISRDDVLARMRASGKRYARVYLRDLMIVAGAHARTDMAGDGPDSLKTFFSNNGFEVTCDLDGLGQVADVQDLIVRHLVGTIDSLYSTPKGIGEDPGVRPAASSGASRQLDDKMSVMDRKLDQVGASHNKDNQDPGRSWDGVRGQSR